MAFYFLYPTFISMAKKYPIGIQSFSEIRNNNYHYVDKTERIHELVSTGKFYFLSRPRRFGKSLLLNTIEELFRGKKQLFDGLWISDKWDWTQKHPIIHISFSDIGVNTLGLIEAITKVLSEIATELAITLSATSYDQQFKELIQKAAVNGNVVVLIDEYDKPIIDFLDDVEKAEWHLQIMKNFYSIIKGADAYIRFFILAGVSRFSKVSIFSDLNNLNDITLSTRFGTLAGITQEELENNFATDISTLKVTNPKILDEIKLWYNGYSWDNITKVYNPFSVLNFMAEPVFRNYWFATGSPGFLIKKIRLAGEYNFENIQMNERVLGNFDIENTIPAPLLFQTGYLTIKSYNKVTRTYTLDYPNQEVRDSLLDNLLSAYRGVFPADSASETGELLLAINQGDVAAIIRALNAVISSMSYNHWCADTESIFRIITYLTFKKIGVDIYTEVHNHKGRCDVLIKTDKFIYVMELKLNGNAGDALQQVVNSQYLQPYMADSRKKIALGINFSQEARQVDEYKMEVII